VLRSPSRVGLFERDFGSAEVDRRPFRYDRSCPNPTVDGHVLDADPGFEAQLLISASPLEHVE
jgi:hypothetical protein